MVRVRVSVRVMVRVITILSLSSVWHASLKNTVSARVVKPPILRVGGLGVLRACNVFRFVIT